MNRKHKQSIKRVEAETMRKRRDEECLYAILVRLFVSTDHSCRWSSEGIVTERWGMTEINWWGGITRMIAGSIGRPHQLRGPGTKGRIVRRFRRRLFAVRKNFVLISRVASDSFFCSKMDGGGSPRRSWRTSCRWPDARALMRCSTRRVRLRSPARLMVWTWR